MQEGEYPQLHSIYVFRPIRLTMIETLNRHRNGEALNYHPFRFDDLYRDNPTNLTQNRPAPVYGNMYFFITPRERSGNDFRRTVEGEGVWEQSGDAIDIHNDVGLIIGCMRRFYFFVGDSRKVTNWRMVEYTLPEYPDDNDNDNDGLEAACTLENMDNYGGTDVGTVLQWEDNLDDLL